jgi:hypothetical protein
MKAMVGGGGIEVAASGFEIWRITGGILMKVDGVFARGEVLEGEMNLNALFRLLDGRGSDHGSLGVMEDNSLGGFFLTGNCGRAHQG